jgi:hypothetical protein
VLLLFLVAVVVIATIAIKVKNGGKETPADREFKSRAGAALGNALPPALGGQSTSFVPMPDMTDRIEPETTHVARYEARVPDPESDHPFRKAALPRARLEAPPIDDAPKPEKRTTKKRRKQPPPEPPRDD